MGEGGGHALMHISEGVLSKEILLAGATLAGSGVVLGLKKTPSERIPRVGILSAAFFLASLIHVPLGPASVHLVLNGLMGVLLGWAAYPAIFIGLLLQAILFQFGGLTTLGVNTFNMAFPALLCWWILRPLMEGGKGRAVGGFLAGALSVFLSGILVALELRFTGEAFGGAAKAILLAHLPVMAVEGLVTAFLVSFLGRARPKLLEG